MLNNGNVNFVNMGDVNTASIYMYLLFISIQKKNGSSAKSSASAGYQFSKIM